MIWESLGETKENKLCPGEVGNCLISAMLITTLFLKGPSYWDLVSYPMKMKEANRQIVSCGYENYFSLDVGEWTAAVK